MFWKLLLFTVVAVSARNLQRDSIRDDLLLKTNPDSVAPYRERNVRRTDPSSEVYTGVNRDFNSDTHRRLNSELLRQEPYTNVNENFNYGSQHNLQGHVEPRHIDSQIQQSNDFRNTEFEAHTRREETGRRHDETSSGNQGTFQDNREMSQNEQNRDQFNDRHSEVSSERRTGFGSNINVQNSQNSESLNGRKLYTNRNDESLQVNNQNGARSIDAISSLNVQGLENQRKTYESERAARPNTAKVNQNHNRQNTQPGTGITTQNLGDSGCTLQINLVCYEQLHHSQYSATGLPCFSRENGDICIDQNCDPNSNHRQPFGSNLRVFARQNSLVLCFDSMCYDKHCTPIHNDVIKERGTSFKQNTNGGEPSNPHKQTEDVNANRSTNTQQNNTNRNTGRTIDEETKTDTNPAGHDSEQDRWIWGQEEKNKTDSTSSTTEVPGLDDRAAFNGDKCPSGKIKVNNMCVEKDA